MNRSADKLPKLGSLTNFKGLQDDQLNMAVFLVPWTRVQKRTLDIGQVAFYKVLEKLGHVYLVTLYVWH